MISEFIIYKLFFSKTIFDLKDKSFGQSRTHLRLSVCKIWKSFLRKKKKKTSGSCDPRVINGLCNLEVFRIM